VSAEAHRTYAALRAVLRAHGAGAGALAGLTELATVLRDQRRLTPTAAAQWLQARHAQLGERTPLEVWLAGRPDRVIDAARAAAVGKA
jgi:hypothetical protein